MSGAPRVDAATASVGGGPAVIAAFAAIYAPWLLGAWGLLGGGWWLLGAPLVIFVVVPLADLLLGARVVVPAPTPSRTARWAANLFPRLAALLQPALVLLGAWAVARDGSALTFAAAVLTVGASGGVMGIVSAHELIHRNRRVDLRFAEVMLTTVCHMHWCIEHLGGHHRTIGLPGDPGTARLGETLYAYWWRYLTDSYATAVRLERDRQRRGQTRRTAFSPRGRMFWYTLLPLALAATLGALFGWLTVAFFFLQALLAFTLLAAVNYIEHYGLVRGFDAAGRPQPIAAEHSWDTNCRVSGYVLLNLQLHADHHMHPARGFERLASSTGPQLPTGYMGMFWLALIPPLWRRTMDPAVFTWRGQVSPPSHSLEATNA